LFFTYEWQDEPEAIHVPYMSEKQFVPGTSTLNFGEKPFLARDVRDLNIQ